MRIQHNIAAMNSYRNFSGNTSKLSKNLEKLSTGYKINRAGDDAAGLAISEKMRAQISGLDGATKNAKDGISLIQTAEGALTEVHDMLNRMTTLAEQSANGTYDNKVDRNQLQKEVDALKTEIDRIADSTNYNGIKLLNGNLSGGSSAAGAIKVSNIAATDKAAVAGAYTFTVPAAATVANSVGNKLEMTLSYRDSQTGNTQTKTFTFTVEAAPTAGQFQIRGNSGDAYAVTQAAMTQSEVAGALKSEFLKAGLDGQFTIATNATAGEITLTSKTEGAKGATVDNLSYRSFTSTGGWGSASDISPVRSTAPSDAGIQIGTTEAVAFNGTNLTAALFEIGGKKFVLASTGTNVANLDADITVIQATSFTAAAAFVIGQKTGLQADTTTTTNYLTLTGKAGSSGGLTLQIGDTSDEFNKLTVSVDDMHAAAMGLSTVDISTQEGAAASLDRIKDAVNYVSNTRGTLGALQNRLDHTINNLGVMKENIQSAESLIRDTDVAEEMMAYTKNNILNQSAQAMLAQANQLPQGVLQLLG